MTKFKEKVMKVAWLSDTGRARVLARFLAPVQYAAVFFTFLKVYGVKLTWWQMGIVCVVWVAVEVLLGWVYTQLGLLKIETEYGNEHNPTLQEIKKKGV